MKLFLKSLEYKVCFVKSLNNISPKEELFEVVSLLCDKFPNVSEITPSLVNLKNKFSLWIVFNLDNVVLLPNKDYYFHFYIELYLK